MTGRLLAATLALGLLVPTPLVAQTSDSDSLLSGYDSCPSPPFSPNDQAIVDRRARDIAWILAGGRADNLAEDGGINWRRDGLPSHVLKWPAGAAITVAFAPLRTSADMRRNPERRQWKLRRAPMDARVEAVVGRLEEATGLALALTRGFHLKPDRTINIMVADDVALADWEPMGLDWDQRQAFRNTLGMKRIGAVGCQTEIFYDHSGRMTHAHLVVGFDDYTEADVSRCLTEGLAWTFGVPLWAPEDDKSAALGAFTLIYALYDPRIEPGMTERQVYGIVRDRLCRLE